MSMARILTTIFGFLGLVITGTMGLSIQTANAAVASANITNLIGMDVLTDWGAALIILGLLTLSGIFVYGGITGKATYGMKDLLLIIGASIVSIVGLSMELTVITSFNNLIGAVTTDPEDIIWRVIPLFAYVAIIGASGFGVYRAAQGVKKGRKTSVTVGY